MPGSFLNDMEQEDVDWIDKMFSDTFNKQYWPPGAIRERLEDTTSRCECCQKPEENLIDMPDDLRVCEDCAEKNYFVCDDCGAIYRKTSREYISVNNGEKYICPNCARDDSEYFIDSILYGHYTVDRLHRDILHDTGYMVPMSMERHFHVCDNCGHWFRSFGYETTCEACTELMTEELRKTIHSYDYRPDFNFNKLENERDDSTSRYYGVELEITTKSNHENPLHAQISCTKEIHNLDPEESLFYQVHDGSIGDYGIEVVTHPCTYGYMMNGFPWEKIIDVSERNGFVSHNRGLCGLHVHVSRNGLGSTEDEQDATIAKIVLMVDLMWDNIVKFSRRKQSALDRWACKPDADIRSDDSVDTAIYKSKCDGEDRYRAVNLCNDDTIEFRVFRGTTLLSTIKATLQFVELFCNYAQSHSVSECYNADWHDVVCDAPEELKNYLINRGLWKTGDDSVGA